MWVGIRPPSGFWDGLYLWPLHDLKVRRDFPEGNVVLATTLELTTEGPHHV